MNDHDPGIAAVLDEVTPPIRDLRYEWERVIADAGVGNRRPPVGARSRRVSSVRAVIAAVVVSVGLLIPVLAIGAARGWWFQHSIPGQPWWADFPQPIGGPPAILATGEWHGTPWTGVAFISRRPSTSSDSICFAMIVGSRSNPPQSGGCGALYGMNGVPHDRRAGWVTISNWSLTHPPRVAGAVANGVARVEVVLNPYPYYTGKARTVTAHLTRSPLIRGGIHFFVVPYATRVGIDRIVLYDKNGKILTVVHSG